MMRKYINFILGALILQIAASTLIAQPVAKIGYFMDNATHKHLMNPALVPARGYLSYPALGSFDLDLRSNLSLPQFLYPGSNGQLVTFLHEDVTPEQFLSQLSPENFLKVNQRLSILSFGAYFGRSFWTFEVASRINAGLNIPEEFFAFLSPNRLKTGHGCGFRARPDQDRHITAAERPRGGRRGSAQRRGGCGACPLLLAKAPGHRL